ncbi:putative biosynthetic protein (TIGR04099 family) [Angulomicrobium tetraedrale]|uniref:Putative biosynthetic protein (TIGR04099 family) n=1 Tax=Ancylobacter tetraedralis TaxID=217068 RepID=A0A839Z8C7_9HYPH|nr:Pnap_2097 family protein [Ancylobacter tetraedralis]MBB3770548.1 putative biosynthetic protein (TIGR04099 family) [Ancylobacter tetraedralis]
MNAIIPPPLTMPFPLPHTRGVPHGEPRLLEETVRLGMPQLALGGLSEGWLLKDLGHRHWMMLAAMAGRTVPDFRDIDGAPVYAAFSALAIRDARFAELGENDVLAIRSSIARISRTQCASRHVLSRAGEAMGTVELVSAFVRRGAGGGNHQVARVALEGFPPPAAASSAPSTATPANSLADRAAALRARRLEHYFGFDLAAAAGEADPFIEIDPCPAQDFNGAGFLYFASFVSFIDRAEWHFDGRQAPRAATLRRDVFFHANADPGERVRVRWLGQRRGDGRLAHHCRLERMSDGTRLAEAFTLRAV